MNVLFRKYSIDDKDACLSLFDKNCPEYFAANEREDYENFLVQDIEDYQVCELNGEIIGAFGLFSENKDEVKLDWILLSPETQGQGIGTSIMNYVTSRTADLKSKVVLISTSHKAYKFFQKHGALVISELENGWGPNMHKVEMELHITT